MQWTRTRGILVGASVWLTWAIVPSVLQRAGDERLAGLVRAQVGALAEPYLQLAPPATVAYCCLAPLVMVPVLCALSSAGLRGARPFHAATLARAALQNLLLWCAFYAAGATAAFVADVSRGADPEVATSFWWRLSAYGVAASLPVWGLALWARAVLPRLWQAVGVTILGTLVVASLSLVLRTTYPKAPTPLVLREALFSGRAEESPGALAALLLWGAALLLLTLATRALSTRRLTSKQSLVAPEAPESVKSLA